MDQEEYLNLSQHGAINNFVSHIKGTIDSYRKFMAYIKMTPNNKKNFHNSMATQTSDLSLSRLDLDELLSKKVIAYISKKNSLVTLTLKGIIMARYHLFNPSPSVVRMIDDLNTAFFEPVIKASHVKLTIVEKIFVLALLGVRAISNQQPLKLNEENQVHFQESIKLVVDYLETLGEEFKDANFEKLFSSKVIGESHAILAKMRRLDKIRGKTDGVYKKTDQGHFIDILKDGNVDHSVLGYLLKKVFDARPLHYEEKKELIQILDQIQDFRYRIFAESPDFELLDIRSQINNVIETTL